MRSAIFCGISASFAYLLIVSAATATAILEGIPEGRVLRLRLKSGHEDAGTEHESADYILEERKTARAIQIATQALQGEIELAPCEPDLSLTFLGRYL